MHYNRQDAMDYAYVFSHRVCHDGRVATGGGYPKAPPAAFLQMQDHIVNELDCTHYISCCVGQTKFNWGDPGGPPLWVRGGGLNIPSPFAGQGVYGETYAPRLVGALIANGAKIVGKQFHDVHDRSTAALMISKMTRGDVVAYADEPKGKSKLRTYEHFGILCSSVTIACHTASKWDEHFTTIWSHPLITLLKMPA